MEAVQEFFQVLSKDVQAGELVRLTLSKPAKRDGDLVKVLIKPVIIKEKLMLSFVLRQKTKDITKNYPLEEGAKKAEDFFTDTFQIITLFSTHRDLILQRSKKGKVSLRSAKPTFSEAPDLQHDKQKNRLIKSGSFLTELGVTNRQGRVQKDKGDKFKQIHKFVEIIAGLLEKNENLQAKKKIKVSDMGAGKGYLTFATYDFLVNQLQKEAEVVGVEVRPDLIKKCNGVAEKIGFQNLSFEEGYIGSYDLGKTDILIALHACDTATDDAIQKGIEAGAELIICAPCCHKQVRKSMTDSETLKSVMRYGILQERQAEIITDTIRALLMESKGYKTKVFEFISTEHTGKNLMIVGTKSAQKTDPDKYLKEVRKLKKEFGIQQHYLEKII